MSGLLGPNGMPVRPQRQLPDQVIVHHLSDHDARLNALAAQSVHLGIMVEYLVDQLGKALPDFDLDAEEFAEFRNRRFKEMKAEALEIDAANARLEAQQEGVGEVDIDLDEIDDIEDIESNE